MSTRMLKMMVRHATQSLTPVKLVVEMMRMPVVTPMAMEVFWVCINLMMSSRLKQQEKPSISRIMYCHVLRGCTQRKGYIQEQVVRRNRLIWLHIAQGELLGSPLNSTATIPKRMLGANLSAYYGDAHSIVIDPPIMAPKMMRQKHPCLPASDSQTIANTMPPEAFQPKFKQKQVPTDVKIAAIFSLSSCCLVGRKGISLFFLRMKTRLYTKVTSMATNRNCTGCISSCLAIDILMQSRMGPSRSSDTGENQIQGQSANSLYQYSCMSKLTWYSTSFSSYLFLICANFLSTDFSNLPKRLLFCTSTLGLDCWGGWIRLV